MYVCICMYVKWDIYVCMYSRICNSVDIPCANPILYVCMYRRICMYV